MSLRNSLLLFGMLASLVSCDKTRVFDEYKSVGAAWHKDSIVAFKLPVLDSVKQYNMFVNLRNDNDYPFNNLFLIVSLDMPNGVTKVDTLEYQMAAPDGTLLGDGFTDIKESKLVYKEKVSFKPSGQYYVNIKHAVRQNGKITGVEQLEGVSEVGFRIESIE